MPLQNGTAAMENAAPGVLLLKISTTAVLCAARPLIWAEQPPKSRRFCGILRLFPEAWRHIAVSWRTERRGRRSLPGLVRGHRETLFYGEATKIAKAIFSAGKAAENLFEISIRSYQGGSVLMALYALGCTNWIF